MLYMVHVRAVRKEVHGCAEWEKEKIERQSSSKGFVDAPVMLRLSLCSKCSICSQLS